MSSDYLSGKPDYYQTNNLFNPWTNKPISKNSTVYKFLTTFKYDPSKNILVPFDKSDFVSNIYLGRWLSKKYKLKKSDYKPDAEELAKRKKAMNTYNKFAGDSEDEAKPPPAAKFSKPTPAYASTAPPTKSRAKPKISTVPYLKPAAGRSAARPTTPRVNLSKAFKSDALALVKGQTVRDIPNRSIVIEEWMQDWDKNKKKEKKEESKKRNKKNKEEQKPIKKELEYEDIAELRQSSRSGDLRMLEDMLDRKMYYDTVRTKEFNYTIDSDKDLSDLLYIIGFFKSTLNDVRDAFNIVFKTFKISKLKNGRLPKIQKNSDADNFMNLFNNIKNKYKDYL